jgi:hypothetical protein
MSALSQNLTFKITEGNTTTETVQVVYPNTATTTLVYNSEKIKGNGYYGGSDGVHTVMYTYNHNFVGTITMQATLATAPVEADWFEIKDTTTVMTENSPNYNHVDIEVYSDYYNFTGNFVWVRGSVAIGGGQVDSILYNH